MAQVVKVAQYWPQSTSWETNTAELLCARRGSVRVSPRGRAGLFQYQETYHVARCRGRSGCLPSIPRRSEFESCVHVPALGAWHDLGAGFFRVETVAPNAVKCNFTPLDIIEFPITPIVVNPHEPKNTENQQAIDNDLQSVVGQIHGVKFSGTKEDAKGK